ncbi:MAG: sulfatase-like hydrolase/transferase [Oceanipulchritudo sp.]
MPRPNILFILVDDMGYGDFSAFNGGLSETPVLDGLIAESVCLTQQYTASPVCNPSRACLLTGRYPHRTGSIDTLEWRGLERLALREVTLADVLKRAGYRTGLIGKWHLGAFDPRYHPMRRGFDETVCFRGGMHDYYDWRLEYNDRVVHADGRYLTDVWTDEAVDFLKRQRPGEPFFLHLTYNAPHTPLQVPEEEKAPFSGKGEFTDGVATLYGMLRRMDKGIGRVLEALEQSGLKDNTIVVFSSDNGPQFGGEGEACLDRFNCNLHGAKCHVYEGGIRVPGIIRWPDGLENARSTDAMVHFSDWFPTLLALAGIPVPGELALDGRDFTGVLKQTSRPDVPPRYWQWNRYTPMATFNAAARDGDWKLVRPAVPETMAAPCVDPWLHICMYEPERMLRHGLVRDPEPERNIPEPPPAELYNLADDPGETRNLAEAQPAKLRQLSAQLDAWFAEVEAERATIDDRW